MEITEKGPLNRYKSSAVIYLYCSHRKSKIITALKRHFDVVDAEPSKGLPVLKTFISFLRIYSALRRLRRDNRSLLVMADSLGPDNFVVGVMAKSLHLPFLVRLRGGMWREVHDWWQFKPFPIKQLYRWYYSFWRHQILVLADLIIPVSYFLKKQIIHHYNMNIDLTRIVPVYNPINFAAFDEAQEGNFRKKLNIAENDRIILTVTGFNYYKKYMGIVHYLPAILRVLQENYGWYFVIAGGGHSFERARKSILEMVPENIKDRIIFTGRYEPIEEAFKDADIVVNLVFRESLGNTVLEAQAAGKPVICNDFGGSPELLQNRRDEPRCVIKEAPELYESLTALLGSAELRESIGRKNKEAVTGKFSVESIGDDFYQCINSILNR